jgi:hypothetical protein
MPHFGGCNLVEKSVLVTAFTVVLSPKWGFFPPAVSLSRVVRSWPLSSGFLCLQVASPRRAGPQATTLKGTPTFVSPAFGLCSHGYHKRWYKSKRKVGEVVGGQ